ncbi:MAG: isochorismatase [Cellvibrionaceae bacterium]
MHQQLIEKTQEASQRWQSCFNQGDAAGCASMYEQAADMHAKPFGQYKNQKDIQVFWQQLIDQGFTDVRYIEPNIEVVDNQTTLLTSKWAMNNAQGVITRELWVMQEDGEMRLREDHFEATEA